MKKIFFLIGLSLTIVSFSASAQAGKYSMKTSNGLYLDTVTNAATKNATVQISGYMKTVAVQANITKISGTVGGSATLQGSLDGVNYYPITGASALSLTDVASQGVIWTLVDPGCNYYRVAFTGSGTMSVSVSATAIARKLQY